MNHLLGKKYNLFSFYLFFALDFSSIYHIIIGLKAKNIAMIIFTFPVGSPSTLDFYKTEVACYCLHLIARKDR